MDTMKEQENIQTGIYSEKRENTQGSLEIKPVDCCTVSFVYFNHDQDQEMSPIDQLLGQ